MPKSSIKGFSTFPLPHPSFTLHTHPNTDASRDVSSHTHTRSRSLECGVTCMAAYDIQKHFKGLRVDTGRRKGRRDPFATGFEDDSEEEERRTSRSKTKAAVPPVEKPLASAPAKTSVASPFSTIAAFQDSEDEFLDAPKRTDRRPSPAPAQLQVGRATDGTGRRGSLDRGLLSHNRAPRSAVAQAAGTLAYLDDTDDEDSYRPTKRADRVPSPAPARKHSNSIDSIERSFTPRGDRGAPAAAVKEQSQTRLQPSKHTVASAFAGTKYLEDSESDSDEEAVASRKNSNASTESTSTEALDAFDLLESPKKQHLEVKRVDKPKQNGSGVSWRAFSDGRNQQRSAEIEALQTSLKQRGKSISFCPHALTDDGKRVPVAPSPDQIVAGAAARGRRASRGKSPPRRAEDTKPAEDELRGTGQDGRPDGLVYDPTQYKTNPFTGEIA